MFSAAKPKAAARSPERLALAAAIEAHREAIEYAANAARAHAAATRAVHAASSTLDAAAESLEEARTTAGQALVAAALAGDGGEPPSTIRQARDALQDAEDRLIAAREARDALEPEIGRAEQAVVWKRRKLEEAARAVIQACPAVRTLLDRADKLQRELAGLAVQLRWLREQDALGLASTPIGIPFADRTPGLARDVTDRMTAPPDAWRSLADGSGVSTWAAALAALMADADAPIPGD